MNYLIYNPLAKNGNGEKIKDAAIQELAERFPNVKVISVLGFDTKGFISKLTSNDVIILLGGDGTIHYAANELYGTPIVCPIYLYQAGTGNDFLRDVSKGEKLFKINEYLKKLPVVHVNGIERRFVNGIGFGIDGMACEYANKLLSKGKKKINYTKITIKLLLFKYKCPNATVIVDGKEYHFKKVYLASSMVGRYYGGGMMVAPNQKRLYGTLSLVLFHTKGRIKTLMAFPSIFKGAHLEYKKQTTLITGKTIYVRFNHPTALQIDGEVISNVTEYKATYE